MSQFQAHTTRLGRLRVTTDTEGEEWLRQENLNSPGKLPPSDSQGIGARLVSDARLEAA